MISRTTRRFFVIPLVSAILCGTACAAFADDAAKRTFAFCDKNSDGKLDAAEFRGVPVTMRGWLAKHEPKSKAGITQADFLRVYPTMMADLRNQTRVASSRGTSTTPAVTTDSTADPQPVKTTVSPAKSNPPLYASTPPSDEIVETIPPSNLPSNYQDADLDRDGQIDYFEWRKGKLGDFAKFQSLDLNNDSVLSPQELSAAGGTVAGTSSGSPSGSSSSSSSSTSGSGSTTTPAASSSDPEQQYLEKVKSYFYYMDGQGEKYGLGTYEFGNKNGVLDPKEWNGSSRIKPVFEKAKIDISKPMDETTFILHYRKLFPEPKKEAPKKTGYRFTPGRGVSAPGARTTGRRRRGR